MIKGLIQINSSQCFSEYEYFSSSSVNLTYLSNINFTHKYFFADIRVQVMIRIFVNHFQCNLQKNNSSLEYIHAFTYIVGAPLHPHGDLSGNIFCGSPRFPALYCYLVRFTLANRFPVLFLPNMTFRKTLILWKNGPNGSHLISLHVISTLKQCTSPFRRKYIKCPQHFLL